MNKSQSIREYLAKHYPCAEIPHGDMAAIAVKFECSRELVRHQVARLGLGRMALGTFCPCGQRAASGRTATNEYKCMPCRTRDRYINVACDKCGQLTKRVVSIFLHNNGGVGAHVYCRACLFNGKTDRIRESLRTGSPIILDDTSNTEVTRWRSNADNLGIKLSARIHNGQRVMAVVPKD